MSKDELKWLAQLEREADEATLRYWDAMLEKDRADTRYNAAEYAMQQKKADYLRAKLR